MTCVTGARLACCRASLPDDGPPPPDGNPGCLENFIGQQRPQPVWNCRHRHLGVKSYAQP